MRLGVLGVTLTVLCGHAAAAPAPTVELAAARAVFSSSATEAVSECSDIPCVIERAYVADPKAKALALALFEDTGDVAGVGPDEMMDGGYRGTIHLVPQLPIAGYRKHLAWVSTAMHDIDGFFAKLFAEQTAPSYRWKALVFRFVRSIKKRTPSAYASSWTIEYNVEGSLLTSAAGVRETLFHELFHTNDEAHDNWSERSLQGDYDAIVKTCGPKLAMRCLSPFAPNITVVRGGTFYAFQQNNGNGVHEYAAELAVRYFDEQSEMLRAGKLARTAFKCGPAANARSWAALVNEFFAGRDLVPACRS